MAGKNKTPKDDKKTKSGADGKKKQKQKNDATEHGYQGPIVGGG